MCLKLSFALLWLSKSKRFWARKFSLQKRSLPLQSQFSICPISDWQEARREAIGCFIQRSSETDCYLSVVLFCWGVSVDFKWISYDFSLHLRRYYRSNNVMMLCCCWCFFLISYIRLLRDMQKYFWSEIYIKKNVKRKKYIPSRWNGWIRLSIIHIDFF